MKLTKVLFFAFVVLCFSSLVLAAVTYTLNGPDNSYRTGQTTVLFNWTPTSDLNSSITSFLYVTETGNEGSFILNQTVACTNSSSCNATVSGFSTGFYQWYVDSTDDNGTTNYSSASRWFEIQDSSSENVTNFLVVNDSGYVALKVNKDNGNTIVSGNLTIGGDSGGLISWNGSHTIIS